MTWERVSVTLECGCEGQGAWDTVDPGDGQECRTHGATAVQRISRIRETRGSRDFRLGTGQEG